MVDRFEDCEIFATAATISAGLSLLHCFEVRRNGEVERVKSDDGEADYYNLEAYWPVSALEGRFFRTYIFLYDTMDGVREEIDSLLGLLERDNA